jgi:hypothetical protein
MECPYYFGSELKTVVAAYAYILPEEVKMNIYVGNLPLGRLKL